MITITHTSSDSSLRLSAASRHQLYRLIYSSIITFLAALAGLYHYTSSEELRSELVDDFRRYILYCQRSSSERDALAQCIGISIRARTLPPCFANTSRSTPRHRTQRGDEECRGAAHHPHRGLSRPNLVRPQMSVRAHRARAQRVVPHVVRKTRTPYEVEAAVAGLSVPACGGRSGSGRSWRGGSGQHDPCHRAPGASRQ